LYKKAPEIQAGFRDFCGKERNYGNEGGILEEFSKK